MRISDWSSDVCSSDLGEALAQQAVQDFVAHLRAEALLDDLRRHLAGAETLDPGRARDLAQAPADLVLQALRRQAERHAALEIAQGFNRRTCIYSWHTHSCSPRGLRGVDDGNRYRAAHPAPRQPADRPDGGTV